MACSSERAILYLHGGAYTPGSFIPHRALVARLAQAAGVRALAIDYRLAPEHPVPAALEDAVAAYRWLLQQGFEGQHLVLAGDSAGGGLAVSTLIRLRELGLPQASGAALLSP
ncbi:alpha/beta hydrolase [Deinococcus sp. Arct2-2]|uniref:alpha/beta hydrolase fold domain-containing protein n=1 Tax=Deinococcus sp. Arct2-2 TaxID=2568653 RepID=UPI0010A30F7E|nr:alpha/beta hydrolase fold domain-containing protein [Deinococcus sp. Arct2-2]THF67729.1 alpha/beta hydrolase [Deinococcus sp. Arct2-2]